MRKRAWRGLLVALVLFAGVLGAAARGQAVVLPPESFEPQPPAQASPGGAGEEETGGSLFDAWWARLFCLTLLIPIAGFVRRLFTGWLNLLGVDEERYAGMASAGAGGLIALGLATGAVLSAAGGGLGAGGRGLWNLVAGSLLGRSAAGAGVGSSGPGGAGSPPPGGTAGGPPPGGPPGGPGGPAGGEPGGGGTAPLGPGAGGQAEGAPASSVVPPDDVKGEGLPEAGSAYEARQQAVARMREMAEAQRTRGGQAPGTRARSAGALGVLGDMAHAAGSFAGAAFGMGLGHLKVAEKSSEVFGAAMAAPFRMIEAFMRTPPPPVRSSLDGARYRVA